MSPELERLMTDACLAECGVEGMARAKGHDPLVFMDAVRHMLADRMAELVAESTAVDAPPPAGPFMRLAGGDADDHAEASGGAKV